jgi:dethiobiotin synthetase
MRVFISGTDTNIGKTIISSWLAIHTGCAYFKPIQTGTREDNDSETVRQLSNAKIYPEIYRYLDPLSPHLAAKKAGENIEIKKIILPSIQESLIIEGAGGLLVPINEKYLMIDLIKKFDIEVILVARTSLGTINHTLLSLEALRARGIKVLGVIMNGECNIENSQSIEFYGETRILAEFPKLSQISYEILKNIPLPTILHHALKNI